MIFWKRLWLVANITLECNGNCDWCLVNYIDRKIPQKVMSEETMNVLLRRYKEHIDKFGFSKHNVFLFEGGEPLLYKDLIKSTVYKLHNIQPKIEFIDIFTNGLLLDNDFISWTKENRVNIHFSAGNRPIDFIEETVSRIKQIRKFAVLSVALSYQNLDRLDQLVDLCNKYSIQIRFRHLYQYACDSNYLKKYDEAICRTFQRIIDKNYLFYPYLLYEMTTPFYREGDPFVHHCGKCYYIVDPDGFVRPCAISPKVIGNIHDEGFEFVKCMTESDFPAHEDHVLKIKECMDCEYLLMCGGGCTFTKKITYGDIYKPSPFCSTFKKVYPMVKELGRRWKDAGRSVRF